MALVCAALLLLMLGTSAATPQDLGGKMFKFPQMTKSDHVALKVNQTDLGALTVCMRVFTDDLRSHTIFALYINSSEVLISSNFPMYSYFFANKGNAAAFKHENNTIINTWQALCSTWDSETRLLQFWIDGKHLGRQPFRNSHIMGNMTMILGQTSDISQLVFAGDYSFAGMLKDVHVWDHVLGPMEIHNYTLSNGFPQGNVVDWHSLDFEIHGKIIIE